MALETIRVPDLGGVKSAEVIEILVNVGDTIEKDASIITLEGEKATMEVPASQGGIIRELKVKVGDKLSEGDEILVIEAETAKAPAGPVEEKKSPPAPSVAPEAKAETVEKELIPSEEKKGKEGDIYAGPGVRRLARELDLDLTTLLGSGRKGRILLQDVHQYVKSAMRGAPQGAFHAPTPSIDFSQFGSIEQQPLSKIKKLTGQNTHRSWNTIPHVTQFDEVDITELEAFREASKKEAEAQGFKLTPLVFIMKAVVAALKQFPSFNASLTPDGENLILKHYFHVGVAVDTPNGLVVPVIRDVERKGLFDLAGELAAISKKAREKGLSLKEMQGGCFTISSLGGIGGTAFTPIVNAPEVAILGVSKSQMKPVYVNGTFIPRLMLPLSLSYDHRVIDGAEAARFITYLSKQLADVRRLLF